MTAGKKILVVDDAFDLRESVADVLKQEGYVVSTAADGQKALDLLQRERPLPDLILLDLMMPVMDGWTFMIERQKFLELGSIPVVVFSAQGSVKEISRSVRAAGYLKKPMGLDELLGTVDRVLREYPLLEARAHGQGSGDAVLTH